MVSFESGRYRGTWIHRRLAGALALFCDADSTLGIREKVSGLVTDIADGVVVTGSVDQPDIAQVRRVKPFRQARIPTNR